MQFFKYFRLILVPFVAAMLWIGCAKDDPTPLEKFRILQAHNAIDSVASAALLSPNPVQSLTNLLPSISGRPGVQTATVEGYTLYVTYENGGLEMWSHQPNRYSPPYIEKPKSHNGPVRLPNSGSSVDRVIPGIVGNTRVCLINQVYNDEKWVAERQITNDLQNEFTQQGFQVDVFNGTAGDLTFFQEKMKDYGTIFLNTHGNAYNNVTWIATGEEVTSFTDQIISQFYELWYSGQIAVGEIAERRNGVDITVKYLMVSSKFFQEQYEDESFANSLFYLVACRGMKNLDLAKSLYKKGCQTVVGWTEYDSKGAPVGKEFYRLMLSGKNVGETFGSITPESLHDQVVIEGVTYNAELIYYPEPDGALATLYANSGSVLPVEITSVTNNQVISNRVVRIAGRIKDAQSLSSAILSVNGNAVTLQYDGNFYFDQDIDLVAGSNQVIITVTGTHTNGNPASGQASVKLIGNFPALELWTKLRWNTDETDVDLHLLSPGATYDDLFTEKDCYFNNQSTFWDSYLDVDDVDGWGPEHITIPSPPQPGIYTLVVHYWDSHYGSNPSAFVSVETKSHTWNSGSLNLTNSYSDYNAGDAYAVCQIEFPSGNIYPVEQKIVTPRNENMLKIQKKRVAKERLIKQ